MKYILLFIMFFYSYSLNALNVKETIRNTIKNNINIKIALEEIRESEELIKSSLTNYKPDVSITLNQKKIITEKTTATSSSTVNKLEDSYSFVVKQNLYRGGRNKLELEKSKILFDKQIETFYSTLNNLILQAIDGYLTVQLYAKSLEAIEKNYQVVEQIYIDTLNSKELGVATLVDLKNAESLYELAKSNLVLAKSDLDIGNQTFNNIVGLEPENLETIINIDESFKIENVLKNSLEKNHDLKILINDFKSKKLELEIRKRVKYPTVELTGNATYNDNVSAKGTETTSGSISANISIPIFQKGIEDSNIRKFKSQYIQSDYRVTNKKEEIRLNSIILVNNYKVYQSQINSALASIEAVRISLDVVEKEFEIGTQTFTDLINQEQKLLDSKLDHFNKNKDFLITYFQILSLEGKLIEKFEEYLPKL